jgi:protocatechuate 3,4-dioxygenase beta subunit
VVATNDAVVLVVHPAISLIKLAGAAADGEVLHVVAGSDVVYRYGVMNTGDTALTNVLVNDDKLGFIGAIELMLPAATNWLSYTNADMQVDVTNVAIAVGTPAFSNGVPVADIPDVADTNDAVVDVVRPGYVLTKVLLDPTNRPAILGESLTFRIDVVNTGDVDMAAVPVWDEFSTNDLSYLGATPAAVLTNGAAVYWADVGPLGAGQGTNLVVTFTVIADTAGQYHTNRVVAAPVAPTNYPPFIPATNGAPYALDVPAVLGNYVWLDANGNGLQDGGEVGVSNATVTLYDATNAVVATASADGGGLYLFTNLVPGAYTVQFTPVAGAQFTMTRQGGDFAVDSDAVRSNGLAAVTLVSGETNLTVDAGLYFPANLGDFVWLDVNGNGVQDAGEPGVSNVTVTLYGSASNVVATTVTDVNGAYGFTNLVPAGYAVGFTAPAGYQFTLRNATNDAAADSDPDRMSGRAALVTLSSGQSDTTQDAGLYVPAVLGNYVWWDLDTNGVQNVGEASVSNVVVTLRNSTNGIVATTTSDVNGYYAFTNLLPATYTVAFLPLAGWYFSPTNGTNNAALDSDPAPLTGVSSAVTLLSGTTNTSIDAGIYVLGRIGQTVWVDVDQDGVPDEDLYKYGLSRVRVSLYRIQAGVTNFAGTTLTTNQVVGGVTNNGYFAFEALPFGLYMVTVSNGLPPNLTIQTTPARYTISVGYRAVVMDANFGYNFPPTPVTLKSFAVAYEGDGVRVAWETGVELDNLGFNVYRSAGFAGGRVKLNASLIPGMGTSQGKLYELRDKVPDTTETYYYWLEDVSFRHETELHGPAVLRGSVSTIQGAIGRFTVPTGGLSRISYAVMKAAGLPVETLDPALLKVLVDGHEVAAYVGASGDLLRDGDYMMFYAPVTGAAQECVVAVGTNALRMELVFARPSRAVGDVWAGIVAGGKTMEFLVATNYVRYLLADYSMTPVWVMDVTKPAESKMLYGFSYIRSTNGLSAVYLSYPGANEAKCLGTADAAVFDVPSIRKAE